MLQKHDDIQGVEERENETHDNYITALLWIVAASPVIGKILFPGYFVQGENFFDSLLLYAASAFVFFFVGCLYMVLMAVCDYLGDKSKKNFSIVAMFVICAALYCVYKI